MIKAILISAMLLCTGQAVSAQLNKNFISELKGIMHSSFDELQGEYLEVDEHECIFYEAKKQLTGFEVSVRVDDEDYGHYEAILAEDGKNKSLFAEIKNTLNQLKAEGYELEDELSKPDKLGSETFPNEIHIYKNGEYFICVRMTPEYRIEITREFDLLEEDE